MATFRLLLEYDGRDFEGWQRQAGAHRTVQSTLEGALARLGSDVRVTGAGRTDSGVHAEGQVACARLCTALDAAELARALNGILPADVAVRGAWPAPDDFDPRRGATGKLYRYRVWNGRERSPLRAARFHHVPQRLDVDAMKRAAADLVGEHDFASFQAAGSDVQGTVRELTTCGVRGAAGGEIVLDCAGSGFLRHMVRNVAGTLIEVGLGRRPADSLPALLAARDRTHAGPTAPAHGLTLVRVDLPSCDPGSGIDSA